MSSSYQQRKVWNDLYYLLHERKDLESQNIKIGAFRVEGLKNTRESVIRREFKNLEKAKTFKELNEAITNGLMSTAELGIIKNCDVILDTQAKDTVNVILRCEEAPSKNYSIGSTVSNHGQKEVSGYITKNNLFGLADQWSAGFRITNFKYPSGHLGLSIPHILPLKGNFSLGAHLFSVSEYKGFKETAHGANLILQLAKRHTLAYDFNIRKSDTSNNEDQKNAAGLLTHLHPSGVVSSISHIYLNRTNNGSFLKLINSFAGLGGDVKYISSIFSLGTYIPVFSDYLKFGLRVAGGVRYPLNEEKTLYLNDRLFERMRGFKWVGDIVPGTQQCVGGNVSFNTMGELIFPIHFGIAPLEMIDAHAHVFVNAANVENHFLKNGNTREFKNAKDFVTEFAKAMNVSVGVGLVLLRTYGFRVELNYSYPILEHGTNNYGVQENRQKFGITFESEGYF